MHFDRILLWVFVGEELADSEHRMHYW